MLIDKLLSRAYVLQDIYINFLTYLPPGIEHKTAKILALKKAFYHCFLENLQGDARELAQNN